MGARHVVVTGAGTGIGRAIALRLAGEGVRISLLARSKNQLDATGKLLEEKGARVFTVSCDIRDRDAVDHSFQKAAAACGPIHTLVASAGVGGSNEDGPEDRWDEIVRTNLDGTYFCMRAAVRHLGESGEEGRLRHLVAISSILGRIGVPGYSAYCASKAGVLGLVRALAAELAPRNVQVNAVCPGWVDTAMARQGLEGLASERGIEVEEAHAEAMQQVPAGRMSQPGEIAALVAWLASDDARGVTGQGLDINGGAFMI